MRGDGSYTYEIGKDLDLETGHSDHASAFYMYATQAAEVAVDEESGRVRLLRMSAAHDVGKAINPLNCVAQIEGGVAMGIGSALHEEMVIDKTGKVRNPSFLDYHLVTSLDVPEMIPIIVECPEPEGPYGAKGLGEPGSRRPRRRSAMQSPTPWGQSLRFAAQAGKCLLGDPEQEEKRRRLSSTFEISPFSFKIQNSITTQGVSDIDLRRRLLVNKCYQRFYPNLVAF